MAILGAMPGSPNQKDAPLAAVLDGRLPPGVSWRGILIYQRDDPLRGGASSIELDHLDPVCPRGSFDAVLPLLDELAKPDRTVELTGFPKGAGERCEIPYVFFWADAGILIRRDRIEQNGHPERCFLDPRLSGVVDPKLLEWVEKQWDEKNGGFAVKDDDFARASKAMGRTVTRKELRAALHLAQDKRGIKRRVGRPQKPK